jgi:glycosyltransferase involved in cell wall biosynthesis
LLVRTQHFVRPASAFRTGAAGQASIRAHRILNRAYDGYIAVSEAARIAAWERNETARARVAVIPPGIRLPNPEMVAAAKRQRASGSPPIVVSAGRLEPERRFDVLIRAMPAVLAAFPSCRFTIIGSGAAEPDLRKLALDLGVEGTVTWTGWLPEITAVLASSDVYVNTVPFEGFGMATAEAIACGLPVVVTSTGASVELIDGGSAGIAVDGTDPEQLAAAVCHLLARPDQAVELGRRGRSLAGRFSVESTAVDTLSFYRELADQAPVKHRF